MQRAVVGPSAQDCVLLTGKSTPTTIIMFSSLSTLFIMPNMSLYDKNWQKNSVWLIFGLGWVWLVFGLVEITYQRPQSKSPAWVDAFRNSTCHLRQKNAKNIISAISLMEFVSFRFQIGSKYLSKVTIKLHSLSTCFLRVHPNTSYTQYS